MNTTIKCSKERKKQLLLDLCIITIVSLAVLGVLGLVGNKMTDFAFDSSVNIVLRVAVIGIGAQFGISGLGICIVCFMRKEKFTEFGLNTKNLIPALLLSLICCVPDFIYCLYRGAFICAVLCILIHGAVGVTPDALLEMIVTMILIYGMLIVRKETGNAWGCVIIFLYIGMHFKIICEE